MAEEELNMPEDFDTFDFIVNDEDEVMLLLYEREGEADHPTFKVSPENGTAILYRNDEDVIELSDIGNDIFDSLADADKLLVCELTRTENEDDAEISNAYEAEIVD